MAKTQLIITFIDTAEGVFVGIDAPGLEERGLGSSEPPEDLSAAEKMALSLRYDILQGIEEDDNYSLGAHINH